MGGQKSVGPFFLCHREQRDFAVEADEFLNDEFLDVSTAASDAVFPGVLEVVGRFHD